MARIRTIKPEFFRHEGLQDLESANPGSYVMLVFAGLWGHCDKAGHFEWKPRTLKLDVLPFLEFRMDETLSILEKAGFLRRYTVNGKEYGEVVTFEKHQRINGKEAQESERFPIPSQEDGPDKPGSTGEAPGKQSRSQEGKRKGRGREEEGKEEADASPVASESLAPCPQQEILALYSQELSELPQPRVWEGAREKHLRERWRWVLADLKRKGKPNDKEAGLAFFQRMFAYISKSDLLMGRATDWSASLPWIVEAENFAKIIEGNYENKELA